MDKSAGIRSEAAWTFHGYLKDHLKDTCTVTIFSSKDN